MAKTVLFISMSLDGYLADEKGSIDWLSDVKQDESDDTYETFYQDFSAVILGRITYDQITTQLAVGNYPYNNVDSFVITREKREDLSNVKFKSQSVVELVKEKRERYDGTLWIVGGSHVIQPLLEENIIDEYQIAIIPVLLGNGIKLFQNFDKKINLDLVKTDVKNDMVYLTYKKA